jgi:hypothetical protein
LSVLLPLVVVVAAAVGVGVGCCCAAAALALLLLLLLLLAAAAAAAGAVCVVVVAAASAACSSRCVLAVVLRSCRFQHKFSLTHNNNNKPLRANGVLGWCAAAIPTARPEGRLLASSHAWIPAERRDRLVGRR